MKTSNSLRILALIARSFLTVLFALAVVLCLLLWHPIIVIAKQLGERIFNYIVELGSFLLLKCLAIVGTRIEYAGTENLPNSGPLIVISNHQGYADIPILIWALRRFHTCFVAKRSLVRNVPCVSYVLRNNGSALINRKNGHQAMPQIRTMAEQMVKKGLAGCIFPEGTRERDGNLKRFKELGMMTLLAGAPVVPVLPVVIENGWKLMTHRFFPMPFGITIKCTFLPMIERHSITDDEARRLAEQAIHSHYGRSKI